MKHVYVCTRVGCFKSCWKTYELNSKLEPVINCTRCTTAATYSETAVHIDMLVPRQRRCSRWADAVECEAGEDIVKYEPELFELWNKQELEYFEDA